MISLSIPFFSSSANCTPNPHPLRIDFTDLKFVFSVTFDIRTNNKILGNLPYFFSTMKPQMNLFFILALYPAPERRQGISDVSSLSGISGLSFDSTSLSLLLPSPVTLSISSFSACWSFLLNFFQKILQ